jgi:hypothetical protein
VLTLWLNACLHGAVGPDDFAAAVRDDDPQHLLVDWPERDGPVDLHLLPGLVNRLGDPRVSLALPAPGDPLGLAGPPEFNANAVEAGEAVVVSGLVGSYGLVPELDARTVLWTAQPAALVPVLDHRESSRTLRLVLLEATAELVRLDVARWQPEIPDLLLNLAHRPGLPLPPGTTPEAIETLERAALCLEIVDLARGDHGGAVTAFEISERARCLTDLDLAARRAIVAFCSASLKTS